MSEQNKATEKEDPISAQIKEIEDELARTKYNKATQGHIGRLKAKLARLREQRQQASGKGAGLGYGLKKEGDATVVLVGFPSVGKSTLLNRISNAESRIGEYDFTTLNIVPGVMELNGARVQVLDIPGLIEGASEGKGRGREVLSVIRSADLIVIVIEAGRPEQLEVVRRELHEAGFRLDRPRPDVRIAKRNGGGLDIGSSIRLKKVTREMIREVLHEFRIRNAEVVIRQDVTIEEFTDCLLDNRVYVPSLVAVNKIDKVPESGLRGLRERLGDCVMMSAEKGEGLEEFRKAVWKRLGLMRVFMKKPGKPPDMKEPVIIRKGSTIKDVAERLHRSWGDARNARVWGSSRFPGQRLGLDYRLRDRDIVEIHSG